MVISSHSQDPIIQLGEISMDWFIKHHGLLSILKLLNCHQCVSISRCLWELELIGWTIPCEMWKKPLWQFIYSTQFINLYPHLLLGVYLHAQFSQLLSQAMHQLMTCILIFKYLLEFTLMEQSHLPQFLRVCSFEDAQLYSYYWSYVSRPLYLETI